MRRRKFVTLLGGAVAWPVVTRAEPSTMPVVGFLHIANPEPYAPMLAEFRRVLRQHGYIEGQNIRVEYRWANNQGDRLQALAEDLVRRHVDVIVAAGGSRPALAAKAATSTIPIVLAFGVDPVELGLVGSLAHPGGNITGATFITAQLEPKRFEFMSEMMPQAKTIAYLNIDPRISTTAEQQTKDVRATAQALHREVVILEAHDAQDLETLFASFAQQGAGAIVVSTNPLFTSNRKKLLALAAQYKMPAMYHLREFVVDGGLMSYGANIAGVFRDAGMFVGQILKGAKPAELPIRRSTRFELVINLKTAQSLGITFPLTLLGRADEVIE